MGTTGTELVRARPRPAAVPGRRSRLGGALGNQRLTSLVGMLLLLGLAVEGATVLRIGRLLSMHIFVGMLLLGPIALKLTSVAYRAARYYTGADEYRRIGPPAPLMRLLVAPVLVFSTLTLFGTGVALLAVPHRGLLAGLHKASFIVWLAAMSIHVLAYALRAFRSAVADLGGLVPTGRRLRWTLALVAVAAGVAIALATFPLAHPWLHHHH